MVRSAFSLSELKNRYPKTIDCEGRVIELSLLSSMDVESALKFTTKFADHDILAFNRDIQEPKVLEAWGKSIEQGEIISIVAAMNSEIVGTTAVLLDKKSWSAHVGELRILVSPDARGLGLGRALIQESFLIGLDHGLEKLTARMTLDQEGAIAIFEDLGFKTEALLKDHAKDRNGGKHDLLMLSHDVAGVQSMMQAYGVDEAF
jgi:ribosomal protein S18 acetylase RimI-like enzyme